MEDGAPSSFRGDKVQGKGNPMVCQLQLAREGRWVIRTARLSRRAADTPHTPGVGSTPTKHLTEVCNDIREQQFQIKDWNLSV